MWNEINRTQRIIYIVCFQLYKSNTLNYFKEMHTNAVKKTIKKQDNNKSKIQQSEHFFVGQRTDATEEGSAESFGCTSDSLFWVITQVNFIIHL